MRRWLLSLPAVLALAILGRAEDAFVIIVNPDSDITRMSRQEVQEIFMGRQKHLPSGLEALPLEQLVPPEVRLRFYQDLVQLPIQEVRAHFARIYFSGQAQPPHQTQGAQETIDLVLANKGAIGFIHKSQLDRRVRAVLELDGETPEPAAPGRDPLPTRLLLSGFGTLGLASTDTHQVQFRRDASQMGGALDHPTPSVDTRLGVQFSSRFAEDWLATVQVVSRQRYDGSWQPDLQWASLTWTPGWNWQLKFGRLGLERMPNGDYANAGYTMLWARPPVEVFGTHNFNYFDGLTVTGDLQVGNATLGVGLLGGVLDEKAPAAPGTYPLDLTDSTFWGAILRFRNGGFRGRASYSQVRNAKNFKANEIDPIAVLGSINDPHATEVAQRFLLRGHTIRNLQVGGAYLWGPVQAQGAVNRILSDIGSIPDRWNGFLSFGYRVGPVVPYSVVVRAVSRRFADPDLGIVPSIPRIGPPLAQFVTAALHAQEQDQRTLSAGLRWDFAATADLKVQVDRIRSHNATAPMLPNQPGWDGKAMVFSMVIDFIFGGVR